MPKIAFKREFSVIVNSMTHHYAEYTTTFVLLQFPYTTHNVVPLNNFARPVKFEHLSLMAENGRNSA